MVDVVVEAGAVNRVPTWAVKMDKVKSQLKIARKYVIRDMQSGMYDDVPDDEVPDPYLYEWSVEGSGDNQVVCLPRKYVIPAQSDINLVYTGAPHENVFNDGVNPFRVKPGVSLRQNQRDAFDAVVKNGVMQEGILSLGCGRGKTTILLMALAALSRVGQVLVVVPDGGIVAQWSARIKQFVDVAGGVGFVGDGQFDVHGRGIVIGIINSLAQKEYPQEFYNMFSHVVVDESHSTATPVNRNIYYRFTGRRIGLDATPNRADGQGKILKWHIGPILHEDLEPEVRANGYFVETKLVSKRDPVVWRAKKFGVDPAVCREEVEDYRMLASDLAKDTRRNRIILDTLRSAVKSGRQILVLGREIQQLTWLSDQLNADQPGVAAPLVGSGKRAVKMADRDAVLNSVQVVCATQQLAKRAIDKATLDTLFILNPFTDENMLRQAVGRVQRLLDGKKSCMVVVFVDAENPTGARVKQRLVASFARLRINVVEREYKGNAADVKVTV